MQFEGERDAIDFVFRGFNRVQRGAGPDEQTRDISPTRRLLAALNLPGKKREYAVVTGSKGKGSVTAITAKLLQSLGHKTGMVTSPHLTTYRQRFRVDGHMISEADLTRIMAQIAPAVEVVEAGLSDETYLSPQGIFLALALTWFDEQDVDAAVIEVGRGGRFDDNALVSNVLSLFTPVFMEHVAQLGPTLERIAWHKAGIIKPGGYAYSLPQEPVVMDVLRREADEKGATFEWLAPADTGRSVGMATTPDGQPGQRAVFPRYGEVTLRLCGRYAVENASLAIWAAGNMHARLDSDIAHSSPEYVARIRQGLESAFWPGRVQRLSERPSVWVDGAITVPAAAGFLASLRDSLTSPVVTVLAVPVDREYEAVYRIFAPVSDALILTESTRNSVIRFPERETALAVARSMHGEVSHAPNVAEALVQARVRAQVGGTVLLTLAQPAVGDAMAVYGLDYAEI